MSIPLKKLYQILLVKYSEDLKYLATLIDLSTRKVISYTISDTIGADIFTNIINQLYIK
ncbi:MAG: hypothetical protein U0354_08845 [Candidatus Sericytochromatia bacterium]